jgi:prepilin peptidase dependent protein B
MLNQRTRISRMLHARRRGLSIVELMIGVAIGLAIVAGGARMLADGLLGNRRTMVEARITQDLRAATDIMARDLRRAGYWGDRSHLGVSATAASNQYVGVSPPPSLGVASGVGAEVTYSYSDGVNDTSDDNEKFGFRLVTDPNNSSVNVLQAKLGQTGTTANWQPLTDSRTVHVTNFEIRPVTAAVSLGEACLGSTVSSTGVSSPSCCQPHPANPAQCKGEYFQWDANTGYAPSTSVAPAVGQVVSNTCPELVVRSFVITIAGQGIGPNRDVRREIKETVRVRNDEIRFGKANCPP